MKNFERIECMAYTRRAALLEPFIPHGFMRPDLRQLESLLQKLQERLLLQSRRTPSRESDHNPALKPHSCSGAASRRAINKRCDQCIANAVVYLLARAMRLLLVLRRTPRMLAISSLSKGWPSDINRPNSHHFLPCVHMTDVTLVQIPNAHAESAKCQQISSALTLNV